MTYFVNLSNRGLIHIEGEDRFNFLQNLLTNDLKKLQPGGALYACLLTAQGKFLHDLFISEDPNALLIECEGGARAQDLYARLNRYRLRAAVKISVEEKVPVYAIISPLLSERKHERPSDQSSHGNPAGYADPRHPAMGYRSFEKPQNMQEKPFPAWDEHRIRLCIPDGSRDLIPEQSTMDEARMDVLNAIDYAKGCYIGQELTARMHYRGLGKKHLYAVEGEDLPEPGSEIKTDGKAIGEMRSRCGHFGLALIKDEYKDRSPYRILDQAA